MLGESITAFIAADAEAAHNLERIGDRMTNSGERIVFMAGGRLEELAAPAA
jgi:phosphate uptake regulator